MNDSDRIQHLEAALARFTQNRYVVFEHGRYIDTSVLAPGDVVVFDRQQYKVERPRPADIGTAIRTLGPLVNYAGYEKREPRLAERYGELENGGF